MDLKEFVQRAQCAQAAVDKLTDRVTPTDAQIQAAALAKVTRALALIERAQNDLGSACAELSAITGGVPVWTACHKLTDKIHEFWYRVDSFRGGRRFSLDATNIDALARQLAAAAQREREEKLVQS